MKIVSSMFFFIIFAFMTSMHTGSIARSSRIVTKMIHRNSIHSPYRKPDSTSESLATKLFITSNARLSSIQEATRNVIVPSDYRVPIIPNPPAFMVNLSIGTPPVQQLLAIDTGSSFTWVQSKQCNQCKPQKEPLYDPKSSKSYLQAKCDTDACLYAPGEDCISPYLCRYTIRYLDGSESLGVVATETFTFQTSDDGINTTAGVAMGCGDYYIDTIGDKVIGGVLALGPEVSSITTHLGSKFSYCIGNISDTSTKHHYLILGDGAIVEGPPSPLIVVNGKYYVSLEEIIIGENKLDIDPEIFTLNEDLSGGVIIDSGSSLTYLPKIASEKFKVEVLKILQNIPSRTLERPPHLLCFSGWKARDLQNFPFVIFKFENGQTLTLGMDSIFYQMNYSTFCLTIIETNTDHGIIGVLSQQYHNIAYDIRSRTIHFTRTDCDLLELLGERRKFGRYVTGRGRWNSVAIQVNNVIRLVTTTTN